MNNLFNNYLEISISCTLIIAFMAALNQNTYKRYSSKWKYYIWMLLAIRMILPFNLHIFEVPVGFTSVQNKMPNTEINSLYDGDIKNASFDHEIAKSDISSYPIKENQLTKESSFQHESIKPVYSFLNILRNNSFLLLTIVWFIGMMSFLFYHYLTYFIFLNKVKRWMLPVAHKETKQILIELSKELRIKKHIEIVVCKFVSSPMIIGIIHPKVILPSEEFTVDQMRIILKHELIHYKNHDLYFKYLLLLVNAIHWFNPFVYYMVKSVNQVIEIVCDEELVLNQEQEYRKIYSLTILQTITKQSWDQYTPFSTYFHGGKKQMKHRFLQIMNSSPKKKGIAFFAILACLILLSGSLWVNNKSSQKDNDVLYAKSNASDATKTPNTNNILLVGMDGINSTNNNRADSIMLLTIQPESKKITITSFLRDMYVEIPSEGKNKLNASYDIGGLDLLQKTIESNFALTIDGTISIDFNGFEEIINRLGGVNLTLTEKEVSYLNSTNYISNPAYRKLIVGEQVLNGNQALGYTRIRNVENVDGKKNDFGRVARQRELLLAIYNKCKASNLSDLSSIINTFLPFVTTDLEVNQIISYVDVVTKKECSLNTLQVPIEGSYETSIMVGKSVLAVIEPDIVTNKEVLQKIIEP